MPMTLTDQQLQQWVDSLQRFAAGDYGRRLDGDPGDPLIEKLRSAINQTLQALQERDDVAHGSAMELAMGISDCFSVLTEVKRGRLDVQVSKETLGSHEELVAGLGAAVNDALAEIRDLSERQQLIIRELSTPVLQVWDGVIVLPLIGIVDTRRTNDVMEKVLRSIGQLSARFVILDLTGVDTVDTKTADNMMKVVRAGQLLGAHCVLTGIQAAVARTLVEVGVDFAGFKTLRNLQAGLRWCLKELQDGR